VKDKTQDPKLETPPADSSQATAEDRQDETGADQDEIAKRIQSEADKRVSEALRTARAKWEKELEEKKAKVLEEAERSKLEEQGKYKELQEKTAAELKVLKEKIARAEFRQQAHAALVESELGEFSDLALAERSTVDGVTEFAKALRETIDKKVAAEVAVKLGTNPKTPSGDLSKRTVTRFSDLKTQKDKLDFIAAHGADAYEKLVFANEKGE
jgi:actin-related protein